MDIEACKAKTYEHVLQVQRQLNEFAHDLIHRGEVHDASKFEEPELSGFAIATEKLAGLEYGSKEYLDNLKDLTPTLEHHYSKNRHHPEHFPDGIDGMTLIDLLECLADWKAATGRNKAGNIRKSLDINAERYGMSKQLKKIFENTIREYAE